MVCCLIFSLHHPVLELLIYNHFGLVDWKTILYTFVENCDQKCFLFVYEHTFVLFMSLIFCYISVGFICLCSQFLNVFFFQPLLFCCVCDILFWLVCLRLYRHLGQCFHLSFFPSYPVLHLSIFLCFKCCFCQILLEAYCEQLNIMFKLQRYLVPLRNLTDIETSLS